MEKTEEALNSSKKGMITINDNDLLDDLEEDLDLDNLDFIDKEIIPLENNIEVSNPMLDIWGIQNLAVEEVNKSARMYSMKHGLFAGVPLLCKDEKCNYIDVCTVSSICRKKGQRCPMEAGAILARFEAYCQTFNVGKGDIVRDEEQVDLSLIRDIVDIEIQILRADNKIAINGDFISETLHSVDKQGNPWYELVVSPEVEFKYTLMEKRHKILQLLNSTRKDNKEVSANDPSIKASIIMKKVEMLKQENNPNDKEMIDVIDVTLDDNNLVNEDGSINYDIIDHIADKI